MAPGRNPGKLLKHIISDAVMTLAADAVVLACFFVFYRILVDHYGAENLGVYTLMRRYAAMLLPLLLLGLSDGLGRFIAQSAAPATRAKLVLTGALGVFALNALAFALLNLDAAASADWLFGDASFHAAVLPFSVLLSGLSMHAFVYACLRGYLRVALLNAMQLVNLGVAPVAALLVFEHMPFERIIVIIGIANFAIAVLFLASLARALVPVAQPDEGGPGWRALYAFSLSRIPAAMIGAGLASLAPIIAKDHVSMTEVGYLSLSLALLLALGGAVLPLGTVLLPHISALAQRHDTSVVGERLHLLIGAALQVFLFATFQFFALAEFLIAFWMGASFLPAVSVACIVLAALPFFGLYCATRSVLDAVSLRPINSWNTVISLAVLLGIVLAALRWNTGGSLLEMFAAACAAAIAVLGTLTYVALRTIFPRHRATDARHALWGLALAGALFLLSLAAQPVITSSVLVLAAYECSLFGLYLWALHLLRFDWPRILLGRAMA